MVENIENDWQENEYVTDFKDRLKGNVLFQNMRSMRSNFIKLKDFIEGLNKKPLVVAVNEIWSPLPWQENLEDYHKMEKRERKGNSSNKGGGVGAFYVKIMNTP